MYNWTKYLHVYDKKDKIIKRHKRNDYWKIMRLVNELNKRLYAIAKWTRNVVTTTNTKTTISQLSNENVVVTTTKKKAKLLFFFFLMTHTRFDIICWLMRDAIYLSHQYTRMLFEKIWAFFYRSSYQANKSMLKYVDHSKILHQCCASCVCSCVLSLIQLRILSRCVFRRVVSSLLLLRRALFVCELTKFACILLCVRRS